MKNSLGVVLLTAAVLGGPTEARSAEVEAPSAVQFSLATDVLPWALDGFSVVAMLELPSMPRLRFGTEVWGLALPQALIELESDNGGEGWQRRIDYAFTVYADYHLDAGGEGTHFGLAVNGMHSTVDRGGSEKSTMWTLEVVGRAGYRFFPWADSGFFLNPWAGLGYLAVLESPAAIDGEKIKEPMFQFLGTVHLGWRW